jgi:hypothetical protein
MSHLFDSRSLSKAARGVLFAISASALAQSGTPLTDSELVERLTAKTFAFPATNGGQTEFHFGTDARFLVHFPNGTMGSGTWKAEGNRLCVDSWIIFCTPIAQVAGSLKFNRQDGSLVDFTPREGFSPSAVGPAMPSPALASRSKGPATVRAGDSWTFDRIEKDGTRKVYTETVVAVMADQTVTVKRGSTVWRVSSAFNPYDTRGGEIELVRLPLAVGDTWEFSQHWLSAPYRGTNNLKARVEALEKVQVPAGTFDAYRITANGWQQTLSHPGGQQGRVEQTYWYVPELKRIVKFTGFVRWSMPWDRNETWSMNYELRSASVSP